MRKVLLILGFVTLSMMATAQTKYLTKTGYIGFYSHTPMEDIKAANNQVAGIINSETGELLLNVLMKSFKFDRALMEEHFNENYVESDKYPKASFKGKISNLAAIDLKKVGAYDIEVAGDISIHGVTKQITAKGTLEVSADKLTAKSKFLLDPRDYNIQIPGVVKEKIADNLEITVEMPFVELAGENQK